MKEISIDQWNRKSQFEFFNGYDDPFFQLTANLNVSNLYAYSKAHNLSFSLACIFVAIKCMNEIPAFKLRIKNGKVIEYGTVSIGSTILNEDNTFSFCDFPHSTSIFEFNASAKKIIKKHSEGVTFDPQEEELQIVHCSTLPWVSFTGFKHARKGNEAGKGIPKIVFGALFDENNIKKIPFSVEVHHALMDGFHVGLLFKNMQQFINELS